MQFDQLKRRELIALLGCAGVALPFEAGAQQPSKLPTIGYQGPSTPSAESQRIHQYLGVGRAIADAIQCS